MKPQLPSSDRQGNAINMLTVHLLFQLRSGLRAESVCGCENRADHQSSLQTPLGDARTILSLSLSLSLAVHAVYCEHKLKPLLTERRAYCCGRAGQLQRPGMFWTERWLERNVRYCAFARRKEISSLHYSAFANLSFFCWVQQWDHHCGICITTAPPPIHPGECFDRTCGKLKTKQLLLCM